MSRRIPPFPPITEIRRFKDIPPHGGSEYDILESNRRAAENPLVTGSPEFIEELHKKRPLLLDIIASRAGRSSSLFHNFREVGITNNKLPMAAADNALNSKIELKQIEDTLRRYGQTLRPYRPPVAPARYSPPRFSSPHVTPRPSVHDSAPPKPSPIVNSRSTLSKLCNGVSCGLYSKFFGSRRTPIGGRRTIRKKNQQTRRARKV